MNISSDKVSDSEARKRRDAYRGTHRWCWVPVQDKASGLWHPCLKEPAIVEHTARQRGTEIGESVANYFPMCDFPVGDHHQGWKHNGSKSSPGEAKARLIMFAVKLLVREASPLEVAMLLDGRKWWDKTMPETASLQDVLLLECQSLYSIISLREFKGSR